MVAGCTHSGTVVRVHYRYFVLKRYLRRCFYQSRRLNNMANIQTEGYCKLLKDVELRNAHIHDVSDQGEEQTYCPLQHRYITLANPR
jgi:hypothetical protein